MRSGFLEEQREKPSKEDLVKRKVRSENKKYNYFTCTVDGEWNNFSLGL